MSVLMILLVVISRPTVSMCECHETELCRVLLLAQKETRAKDRKPVGSSRSHRGKRLCRLSPALRDS